MKICHEQVIWDRISWFKAKSKLIFTNIFFPRKFSFCKKPNHCIGDHNIQSDSLWKTIIHFLKVESHDPRLNENKDSDIENEESNHGGEVFDDPNELTKTKVSILGVAALWDDCMDQN